MQGGVCDLNVVAFSIVLEIINAKITPNIYIDKCLTNIIQLKYINEEVITDSFNGVLN